MTENSLRRPRALSRTVYLLCGLPFVFLALLSHGHAAGLLFLAPVIVCVLQAFRPSRAMWAALFLGYLVLTGAFGLFLAADFLSLVEGGQPEMDLDDAVVFVLLELFLGGFTVGLYKIRPPKLDEFSENPFAYPPRGGDDAA